MMNLTDTDFVSSLRKHLINVSGRFSIVFRGLQDSENGYFQFGPNPQYKYAANHNYYVHI